MLRRLALASALTIVGALAACAPAAPTAVGTWTGEGNGQQAPSLELQQDGRLAGTDGCNRLMGTWKQDGDSLTFIQIASTAKFCEGVDVWLSGLETGTIDGETMAIFDKDGSEIGRLTKTEAVAD